jgi:hypothetical protein
MWSTSVAGREHCPGTARSAGTDPHKQRCRSLTSTIRLMEGQFFGSGVVLRLPLFVMFVILPVRV